MSLDVSLEKFQLCEIYTRNITHNLNKMADAAGIYQHLWRPDELNIETAGQLIQPLKEGLAKLLADPEHYRQFNPPNGWGNYETLVDFVRTYLAACQRDPNALVSVSR
jgi:hypothetical protein